MRTSLVCILSAATLAVAFSFFARQRVLNELRAGNESLLQQLEAPQTAAAFEPASETQPTNSSTALSPEERLELLRLRGQIVTMRIELQAASNRVVSLTQPKPDWPMLADGSPALGTKTGQLSLDSAAEVRAREVEAFQRSETLTNALGFAMALRKYLQQNAGQLPDDLAKVEAFGGPALPPGVSQRFELVHSGTVAEPEGSFKFLAREKEAHQWSDPDWWRRIYIDVSGGMITLGGKGPQPDWPALERAFEEQARQRAQQRPSAPPR